MKPQEQFINTCARCFAASSFAVLCILYLVACNTAKTISIEALGDVPAGVTSRFVFPTSGSNAEAYLTRPAGPGPFPLMILLHGHALGSIGAGSMVPEAEAFASDLCYAGLAVSLPGYGATEVRPGTDPKITLDVVLDAVSLDQEAPVDRFEAILPLRFLPWRVLHLDAGKPDRRESKG